ncbi:MAG: SDR family oxidoreductase [Thermoanaerobaculia bacterium]|nr:SDR family oxidoreductase [Thermoanaerobaculia bacterium]
MTGQALGAAVISGAGSGIGRAAALALAQRGHPLVLLGRSAGPIDATLRVAGGKGIAVVADVRDAGAVQAAVEQARAAGFRPQVVVPSAGVARVASFGELTPETWRESLETNLLGAVFLYRACLPDLLERGGHLFALLSVAAKKGFPDWSAYAASKWGLRGAVAALREELAGSAVRITEIYPGATDSPLWEGVPGEWNRASMISPEAVAKAIVWALDADPTTSVEEIHLQPRGGNL